MCNSGASGILTSEARVPARQRLRPPCEVLRYSCCLLSLLIYSPPMARQARSRVSLAACTWGRVCLGASQRMACSAAVAKAQRHNFLVLPIVVVDLARDQGRWNTAWAVTESPRVAQRAVSERPSCDPKSECRQRQKSYSLERFFAALMALFAALHSHPVLGWSMGVTQGICCMVD